MRESIADSSSGRGGAKLRAVGLEIEEGRAVDAVEPPDIEDGALAGDERHDGRPDRVGPHRRADGEGPLREAVPARTLPHEIAAGLMQPVEDLDPLERLDPFERRGPRRADLDPAEGPVGAAVVRAVGARWPRRPDDADEDEAGVDRMRPVDRNLVLTDVVVRRHDGSGGPLQGPRSSPGLPASGSRGRLLSRRIDAMLAFPHWLVNSGLMPSRRATPSATPSPRPARGSAKGPTREALLAALAERERELAEALARQTATSEILRVISQSPTDAKPVFQRIVVTAARLLRCDMAFVLLREGDAYVHTAGATPEGPMADLAPERIPIDPSANFPSRAFLARTMLHLADWSQIDLPEHERRIHEMFGVNSVLYLPLLRGEECIGVLVFGGRRANIFGPSEIAQAESFRDQALIAMENARLFRETREALEQQKASAEVLGAISKSVADTSPVFETILDACQRLFGSEEIGIYTIGDDEMVRAAAWRGPRAEEARQDVTPLAESVTGRVIRERRTHHIPDLGAVPNLSPMLRDRVNRHGGASLLYAPMLWEDSGLGSIAVVRWPPRPFSDREQALLQSFADQAVIAIQNARIFEEVQAKTRDLTEALQQQTATAEVLKVISRSAFDLTLATTTILEAAAKLCRAPLATLHLRDGEVCRLVTQFGLPEAFERQAREAPIPIRYPLHSRRSARAGEFAHFSDAWTDPDYLYKATARLGGYRAIVVIPLMREGELVGIFSLGRPEPEPFTESQIKLTQTFADQAAIAIENARLFNEVKARTDELSEALEHQKASGEVLRAIAQSVADATPPVEGRSEAPEGNRRPVTVLFCDLVGYTRLSSQLDPEDVHTLLERFFTLVDAIVDRFGGTIDKHIGDAAMALFGAPVAHGNDAERAVRAALEIHASLAALDSGPGPSLSAHIGVAMGEVVASSVGGQHHRGYTVTGEAANLAARLLARASSGETLVSDAVYRATSHAIAYEPVGSLTLKGLDRPVEVWRPTGTKIAAADAHALVGRRAEMAQFRAVLDTCIGGTSGAAILIRGEAGIGKTRLMEELQAAALASGMATQAGLVLDFGTERGHGAVRTVVAGLIGLGPGATPAAIESAIDAARGEWRLKDDDALYLRDLLELPQPDATRGVYEAMDAAARTHGKERVAAELVRACAGRQPLLIAVEDIHWADAETLSLLAAITRAAAVSRTVLAMTTRLEGDPLDAQWRGLAGGAALITVDLAPLSATDALTIARGFIDGDVFAAQCVERAGGNPLLLEQLLRSAGDLADGRLPSSIQNVVLARTDLLSAEDRRAIQAASVLGQRFTLPHLRALLQEPRYAS